MFTLSEREVSADLSLIERAWSQPETFAFLPDRSGMPAAWAAERMTALPAHLRDGHFVVFTSGSTGEPKLVVAAKKRAEQLTRVLHVVQESEPVKETILALPLTYCFAFVNQWLWSIVMKRAMVPTRGFSQPDTLKEALLGARDAMLCLVGAQVPFFAQHYRDLCFPGVTRLHFAGGPFPQDDIDLVRAMFPSAMIFNNYGCAEAMPRLTSRHLEESDEGSNVGRPLPEIEMMTGARGEILFRSPYRCVGQIDAEGFSPIDDDSWVPSGDLGHEIERGCWQLTGRANEVFKRYGEKIALPQLIRTVRGVWPGQAAFYREKDSLGEDGHVLVIAPAPTKDQLGALLQAFRANHSRIHWPLRIESVASMPLLANGKVDVQALASLEARVGHWRQRT